MRGNRNCHEPTRMIFFHNMRDAPDVAQEPTVRPVAWRIVRTLAGSSHLVAVIRTGTLRITSTLKTIHASTRTAVTESGRVYELAAGPADNLETVALLMARARLELQGDFEYVSAPVWTEVLRSNH